MLKCSLVTDFNWTSPLRSKSKITINFQGGGMGVT